MSASSTIIIRCKIMSASSLPAESVGFLSYTSAANKVMSADLGVIKPIAFKTAARVSGTVSDYLG